MDSSISAWEQNPPSLGAEQTQLNFEDIHLEDERFDEEMETYLISPNHWKKGSYWDLFGNSFTNSHLCLI